jgi:2-polyprenyl-3-methyl-5-hydroxy-6-metoxy-1,4-benzoquinol methylase
LGGCNRDARNIAPVDHAGGARRNDIRLDQLSADDRSRFRSLESIFAMPREEAVRVFSPYFTRYHARLYREKGYLGCILDLVRWWSALLDVKGKEMLDIGCGFGVYTLLFTFFGAKRVYGADHNEEKFEYFSKILSMVKPEVENVTLSLQDGHRLSFDDGRFPVIFIKDVISHVRSLDEFLSEVARLLAPGGRALITDENNALELLGRRERRGLWNAWEWKGVADEDRRAEDPPKTYREMRREDIADHLAGRDLSAMPGLKKILPGYEETESNRERALDTLARLTQGLWGDEVTEGADQILKNGAHRFKPEFLYRQPRTGDCLEREFNPFRVAKRLGGHGIDARVVRPLFSTRKPLLNIIGRLIRATHPLSILVQPNFYILGTKRAR